jgi:tRNA (guanine37-N1)-methyltransferase
VAIEACVRLLPGVLGEAASLSRGEFRRRASRASAVHQAADVRGARDPEVLLSGHHGEVARWRRGSGKKTTRERRPDLWAAHLANQQAKGD